MRTPGFGDRILGPVVRSISEKGDKPFLYLTFDDGPDPLCTPAVVKVLQDLVVPATFFVVGKKAAAEPELVHLLEAQGHAIGNHSYDHRYQAFFAGFRRMKEWIAHSEAQLEKMIEGKSVGFRSPAGVRTPELRFALRDLSLPHVMWSTRFFDSTFGWKKESAFRSLDTALNGDIILLHDAQKAEKLELFLTTLRCYIGEARNRGFEFKALRRDLCVGALKESSSPPKTL